MSDLSTRAAAGRNAGELVFMAEGTVGSSRFRESLAAFDRCLSHDSEVLHSV